MTKKNNDQIDTSLAVNKQLYWAYFNGILLVASPRKNDFTSRKNESGQEKIF